jgi:hypothetical protein
LSSATRIPVSTLHRLMRGLAHIGVFAETAEGRFANTEVSEYIRSDVSPSLRELILCNYLCQKHLLNRIPQATFGANVARIIRLADLHAGQIIGSRRSYLIHWRSSK